MDLEHVSIDFVGGVLKAWEQVLRKADAVYNGFDPLTRLWVEEHGSDFVSLLPALALMRPSDRHLACQLVSDGLATIDGLSHPAATFGDAVEQVIARAKSSGAEMGGVDDRVAVLEERVAEIEEWNSQLAEVLRRRTEELREASGRLDSAERKFSTLLERHDELERYAADQLGRDVADLRKAVRGIGLVASALETRPVQVDQ